MRANLATFQAPHIEVPLNSALFWSKKNIYGGKIMKRKFVLIAALVAALAVVFIGCPYPTNGGGESPSGGTGNTTPSPGPGTTPGGDLPPPPPTKIKGLQVTTVSSWAGFDLKNDGFTFAENFTIYIKGVQVIAGQILLNIDHSDWLPVGGWNPTLAAGEEFERTLTLTTGEVTQIGSADPTNIRIRQAAANKTFIVFELIVKNAGGTALYTLSDVLQGLDAGETNTAVIFDGTKTTPAGGPANVIFEIVEVEE